MKDNVTVLVLTGALIAMALIAGNERAEREQLQMEMDHRPVIASTSATLPRDFGDGYSREATDAMISGAATSGSWRVLTPQESRMRDAHPEWDWSLLDSGEFTCIGTFDGHCPRCHQATVRRMGECYGCETCAFTFKVWRSLRDERQAKGRR